MNFLGGRRILNIKEQTLANVVTLKCYKNFIRILKIAKHSYKYFIY